MIYRNFEEAQAIYDNMLPEDYYNLSEDEEADDSYSSEDNALDDPDFDFEEYAEYCRRCQIEEDYNRFLDHLYGTDRRS